MLFTGISNNAKKNGGRQRPQRLFGWVRSVPDKPRDCPPAVDRRFAYPHPAFWTPFESLHPGLGRKDWEGRGNWRCPITGPFSPRSTDYSFFAWVAHHRHRPNKQV